MPSGAPIDQFRLDLMIIDCADERAAHPHSNLIRARFIEKRRKDC
jgi:hypothetical protein